MGRKFILQSFLSVLPLCPPESQNALLGQCVQGHWVDALLVDDAEALVRSVAHLRGKGHHIKLVDCLLQNGKIKH